MTDHETKQHSTLAKQWNDGSEPSLLSESLESIQDPQAFELWSLSFDEGGGQPGSKHSSPADDFIMEMEPSDSDEEPSGSSVSTGVQSRQSSVQQSRQPTPEPPQKPQEGPATMNSNECQDAPTSQPGASEVPLKQEFLQLTGPKAWEMLSRFTAAICILCANKFNRFPSLGVNPSGSQSWKLCWSCCFSLSCDFQLY